MIFDLGINDYHFHVLNNKWITYHMLYSFVHTPPPLQPHSYIALRSWNICVGIFDKKKM